LATYHNSSQPSFTQHRDRDRDTHTISCSLNTQGGDTYFTKIDLPLKVKPGDAILFWNLKRDGSVDADTYHSALPPRKGEKWVAVKWIHERRYQKTIPGEGSGQTGHPVMRSKKVELVRQPVAAAQ
jgi:hypothetical protein